MSASAAFPAAFEAAAVDASAARFGRATIEAQDRPNDRRRVDIREAEAT